MEAPGYVLDEKCLDAIGIRSVKAHSGVRVGHNDVEFEDLVQVPRGVDVKYFTPDIDLFEPMAKAKKGDWLAEHKTAGQTYKRYMTRGTLKCPDRRHRTIYILPLNFAEDPIPSNILEPLMNFATIFFGMPIKVMDGVTLKGKVADRLNCGVYQVHAGNVLTVMKDLVPRDAFCTAGITMCDLYPRESWNFVFGLAQMGGRCGVYSLARYLNNFGDKSMTVIDETKDSLPSILVRACKTMCHEIGHVFGLKHCVYFSCMMNGSNHLEESDSRPNFLCPVCLRKLQAACKFDIYKRYQDMLTFWQKHGLKKNTDWLEKRIRRLT